MMLNAVRVTGLVLAGLLMFTCYTDARTLQLAAVPEQKKQILEERVLREWIA